MPSGLHKETPLQRLSRLSRRMTATTTWSQHCCSIAPKSMLILARPSASDHHQHALRQTVGSSGGATWRRQGQDIKDAVVVIVGRQVHDGVVDGGHGGLGVSWLSRLKCGAAVAVLLERYAGHLIFVPAASTATCPSIPAIKHSVQTCGVPSVHVHTISSCALGHWTLAKDRVGPADVTVLGAAIGAERST